jgi:SOS-response transcriptional repressor LexA
VSELTAHDRRLLKVVDEFFDVHGFRPSISDVGEVVGIRSRSTVWGQLRALEFRGAIVSEPAKARTLRLASTVVRSMNGEAAFITPIERCDRCGQDMPAGHRHTTPREVPNG